MRRPLVLRGACQVGKTWIVREFAKQHPEMRFIELNFDRNPQLALLFNAELSAKKILRDLAAVTRQAPFNDKTLIFFDEIQECPNAIRALRYFHEDTPEIPVIAAGSLLDFALEETGIPVGRVDYLFLSPISFDEFLIAKNEVPLIERIKETTIETLNGISTPFPEIFHVKLNRYFAEYIAIGGMPEVVDSWCSIGSMENCRKIQQRLIESFIDDFPKYAKRKQVKYLDTIFRAAPRLLGKRFVYAHVDQKVKARELAPAVDLLSRAGIIHRIPHSSGNGVPLAGEASLDKFKVIFMDIGLTQRLLGLDIGQWFLDVATQTTNQGAVVEAFVGQELLAAARKDSRPQLHYWVREKKGALAEVDYLIARDSAVIPIEAKSGSSKKTVSMRQFLAEKTQHHAGWHVALHSFGRRDKIIELPFYALFAAAKNWR